MSCFRFGLLTVLRKLLQASGTREEGSWSAGLVGLTVEFGCFHRNAMDDFVCPVQGAVEQGRTCPRREGAHLGW